jgi:biopolymer transport protein ExbD
MSLVSNSPNIERREYVKTKYQCDAADRRAAGPFDHLYGDLATETHRYQGQDPREKPNPLTLVVAINSDSSLSLNHDNEVGSVQRPEKLIAKLRETLSEREKNQVYSEGTASRADLTEGEKIEKSVFIKAPRGRSYGDVVKVIDAVKQAGARPLGLQIDDLQ